MNAPVKSGIESLLDANERLYAPIEVAHIFGLQRATIQELCRTGRMNATKVGTQWRITREEIIRYYKEGPIKPSEVNKDGARNEA
jgi:excisionase family DNA binding protein